MNNTKDLTLTDVHVSMSSGTFELVGYDELKYKITAISDYLKTVEVTEENIKESKKLVARVRKAIDGLNKERIDFKKKYLLPYEAYAAQVKEVSEIAREAEDTVRSQIRELEEIERDEKERAVKELFEKRLRPYEHKELINFDDFMRPTYANKTCSMNKIESEMIEFLEQKENDYHALENLATSTGTPLDELIMVYMELPTPSVTEVINKTQQKSETRKQVNKKLNKIHGSNEPTDLRLRFKSLKDYYSAIYVLKEAGIEFITADDES